MEESRKKLKDIYNVKVKVYNKSRLFNVIMSDKKYSDEEFNRKADILVETIYEALESGDHNLWTKESWEIFLKAPRIRIGQNDSCGYSVRGVDFGYQDNTWKPTDADDVFVGNLSIIVNKRDRPTPLISSQRIDLHPSMFTGGKWAEKISLALLAYAKEDYRLKNCMNQYLSVPKTLTTFLDPQLGQGWNLQNLLDYNEEWFWKYIKSVSYIYSKSDSLFVEPNNKEDLDNDNIDIAITALKRLLQ